MWDALVRAPGGVGRGGTCLARPGHNSIGVLSVIWRRPTIRSIAKWTLGAVLLAQAAVAAQACVMPAFRPAAAFSGSAAHPACEDERHPVDACPRPLFAGRSGGGFTARVRRRCAGDVPCGAPARSPKLAALPSGLSGEGVAVATGPPVYLRSLRLGFKRSVRVGPERAAG